MADGSRRIQKYIEEVTFGTLPSTPTMKTIRNTGGAGIKYDRSMLQSKEMRSDRAVADVVQGNKKPTLDIPFELSSQSFDDFIRAALAGSWTPSESTTGLTVTVVASARTLTRSTGSYITDGFVVGDVVITSGFTAAGNNGTFKILTLTATVMTLTTAATTLVDVTDDTDVDMETYEAVLKCGIVLPSFSVEEGFTDINSFTMMRGGKVGGFTLDVKPDSIITGSFSLVGKAVDSPTSATQASVTEDANTNDVFNSFSGSIKEGGSSIAIITGLSLALKNSLPPGSVVLETEAALIGAGRTEVTGEVSAYFTDDTLLGKYIAGTESSLEFTLEDTSGNGYTFLMDKVKYTSEGKNIPEGSIVQTLGYMALHDTTYTTLQISRVAL